MIKDIIGRVRSISMSEMAGLPFGEIVVNDEEDERYQLKYDKNSNGEIPEVGAKVHVKFEVSSVLRIINIEIVDEKESHYAHVDSSESLGLILNMDSMWRYMMLVYFILGAIALLSPIYSVSNIIAIGYGLVLVVCGILLILESGYDGSSVFRPWVGMITLFASLSMVSFAGMLWLPENTVFASLIFQFAVMIAILISFFVMITQSPFLRNP